MARRSAKAVKNRDDSLPVLPLDEAHWQAIVNAMGLSKRQAQIAELLERGAQHKEIAAVLGIGISTIRQQQERLLHKIGASRPSELHLHILRVSHHVGRCGCQQKC